MAVLPQKLQRFYLEVLPHFYLPPLSQKVVTVMADRDAGAEQLLAAIRGNPAAAGWLSLEWTRATGKTDEQVRGIDYWIPRLGIERCRRAWIQSQLGSLWGLTPQLKYSERISQKLPAWKNVKDPAYSDSAYLAGLMFDLLWVWAEPKVKVNSSLGLIFDSRWKRFERGLEHLLEKASAEKGWAQKRWIAAIAASVSVSELWLHLEDPAFSAQVFGWEARGYPVQIKRLLMRRALGFSPKVIAAWIADAFPVLAPYREVIRLSDSPEHFAADRKELYEIATLLGGSSEVG